MVELHVLELIVLLAVCSIVGYIFGRDNGYEDATVDIGKAIQNAGWTEMEMEPKSVEERMNDGRAQN